MSCACQPLLWELEGKLGLRSLKRGRGGRKAIDDTTCNTSCKHCPSDLLYQLRSIKGIQTVIPGAPLLASRTLPNPNAQYRWCTISGSLSPRDESLCCGAVPSETSLCFRSPRVKEEGNCKRTNNILKNRFHLHTSPMRERRRYTYPRCRSDGDGESALAGRVVGWDLQGGD